MGKWTADDIPDQNGRTIVVTGANAGLGLESAKRLAERGARVILAARKPEAGREALKRVAAVATGQQPSLVPLDLADLDSVATAAGEIAALTDRVDVLMNNAGVMAIPKRSTTAQGFETQLGVNHLGHVALTVRLVPLLLAAGTDERPARVVTLGSIAHLQGKITIDDLQSEQRYDAWRAYNQSKLANVMYALELDKRAKLAGLPLLGVSSHPGVSTTALFQSGPQASGFNPINKVMQLGTAIIGQSPKAGALGQLRAATDPETRGGEYYGPTGFNGWRGPPVIAPVSKRAMDDDMSTRLWDASEQLVGVTFDDAVAATT
ncbi:MAG: oxidoreductase [Solirubrobacteraceae bacterium]|nr:oxidoreductase [Solirubrobacteraceae bacterium]